jgi:L-fucose isomerase-like protein
MIVPKVGFMTPGGSPTVAIRGASARRYWGEEVGERASTALKQCGLDVVAIQNVAFSVDEITEIAAVFRSRDVDLVVVYFTGIGEEALIPHLANELPSYPILLWGNLGKVYWKESRRPSSSIMGVIHSASNLKAMDRAFSYVLGDIDDADVLDEIRAFARGAAVAKKARRAIVGSMSSLSAGQLDTAFNESEMRRVVADVDSVDAVELVELYEQVSDEEAESLVERVLEEVGVCTAPRKDLIASAKTYLALKTLIAKYNLQAITSRVRPGLMRRGIYTKLASSLLSEEGIPCHVHEHDVPAAITELLLRYLTDLPSYTGELSFVQDLTSNTVILSHTGFTAFSLANKASEVTLSRFNMVKDVTGEEGGVEVQFAVKPGRVTLTKLGGRLVDGKLRMFIVGGEVVELPDEWRGGDGCRACFKPDVPVRAFLDAWISQGVEHHVVVVHADVIAELKAFCAVKDIEAILP